MFHRTHALVQGFLLRVRCLCKIGHTALKLTLKLPTKWSKWPIDNFCLNVSQNTCSCPRFSSSSSLFMQNRICSFEINARITYKMVKMTNWSFLFKCFTEHMLSPEVFFFEFAVYEKSNVQRFIPTKWSKWPTDNFWLYKRGQVIIVL